MKDLNATCPKCAHQFELTSVLTAEIQLMVTKQSKDVLEKKENEISELKEKMIDQAAKQKKELDSKVLAEVERALQLQKQQLGKETELKLTQLEEFLNDSNSKLQLAQKNELELRKRMTQVDEKERELDLLIERKLEEQSKLLREHIMKQVTDDFHRKDVERESLISDLRRQVVEMKNLAELGSQQRRGEIFEEEAAAVLREAFPEDSIEDVPKGVAGADLIQTVVSPLGHRVGKMAIELKQAKVFQSCWVDKLREDRNALGADLGILITSVMPKGRSGAYLDQGIWVVEPQLATCVIRVSRQSLIEVSKAVTASTARHEKADILYAYLTNTAFRQRLEAIVESFTQMRDDLDREKRAISKTWKHRERQLENVIDNTAHIYGDIQSVVGQKAFTIALLEMPNQTSE